DKTVEGRLATTQDKNIISLFHPKRLLEITQFFTLFDKDIKKVARYQQYFAIKEIIKTIEQRDENGNRQSGVIWHTQGSGKSLTMVMLSRYILSELHEYNRSEERRVGKECRARMRQEEKKKSGQIDK